MKNYSGEVVLGDFVYICGVSLIFKCFSDENE